MECPSIFQMDMSWKTVQTKSRWLLEKQSDHVYTPWNSVCVISGIPFWWSLFVFTLKWLPYKFLNFRTPENFAENFLKFKQRQNHRIFYLFDLILNVPVNNFSVMLGRRPYSWVLPVLLGSKLSLAQGNKHTDPAEDRTRVSRSGVWRSNH